MSDERVSLASEPPLEDVKETVIVPTVKKEPSRQATIRTDSKGVINPTSIEDAYRYASAIHKSGLAPKQFDSVEKILVAMQTAKELGLPALTSIKNMYVVNGSVALYGDLPLALVRRSGFLDEIKELQFDKNGKEICGENNNLDEDCLSAQCYVKRSGENGLSRYFTWSEVVKAGLDKSKWGEKETYKNFRKRMLQMRARSWALKDVFSDVLMGISIFEYDQFNNSEKDVTEIKEKKMTLNDKLNLKPIADEPEV